MTVKTIEELSRMISSQVKNDEIPRNIIINKNKTIVFMQTNKNLYSYNTITDTFNTDEYIPSSGSIIIPQNVEDKTMKKNNNGNNVNNVNTGNNVNNVNTVNTNATIAKNISNKFLFLFLY